MICAVIKVMWRVTAAWLFQSPGVSALGLFHFMSCQLRRPKSGQNRTSESRERAQTPASSSVLSRAESASKVTGRPLGAKTSNIASIIARAPCAAGLSSGGAGRFNRHASKAPTSSKIAYRSRSVPRSSRAQSVRTRSSPRRSARSRRFRSTAIKVSCKKWVCARSSSGPVVLNATRRRRRASAIHRRMVRSLTRNSRAISPWLLPCIVRTRVRRRRASSGDDGSRAATCVTPRLRAGDALNEASSAARTALLQDVMRAPSRGGRRLPQGSRRPTSRAKARSRC
jgi:hypothetical protein